MKVAILLRLGGDDERRDGRVMHRRAFPPQGTVSRPGVPQRRADGASSFRGAAAVRAFLCPDCAFRHGCDQSCGYCQTGGASPSGDGVRLGPDFPGLANGDRAVVLSLRTAEGDERDHHGHRGVQGLLRRGRVHLRRLELVREVGAQLGVLVRPELSDSRGAGSAARTGCAATPGRRSTARRSRAEGAPARGGADDRGDALGRARRRRGDLGRAPSVRPSRFRRTSPSTCSRDGRRRRGEPEQHRGRVRRRRDRARADEPRGRASGVRGGRHDGFVKARTNVERPSAGDDSLTPDAHRAIRRFRTRARARYASTARRWCRSRTAGAHVIELVEKTYAPFYTLGEPVATLEGDGPEGGRARIVQITG